MKTAKIHLFPRTTQNGKWLGGHGSWTPKNNTPCKNCARAVCVCGVCVVCVVCGVCAFVCVCVCVCVCVWVCLFVCFFDILK
jgi:hypothetical protein